MTYQQYIDLGFKRMELNDNIEFINLGYSGYVLVKKLNKSASIEVLFSNLNQVKLYINKPKSIECYICEISVEQLLELIK